MPHDWIARRALAFRWVCDSARTLYVVGMKDQSKASITRRVIALVVLLVAGCATTGNYEKVLRSWMGNDVNSLIVSWGPPSDVYTMPDGRKAYTWLRVGGTRVTANYNRYLNMVTAGSVTYWCKTTFTTTPSGVVRNWRWEGNACRSR